MGAGLTWRCADGLFSAQFIDRRVAGFVAGLLAIARGYPCFRSMQKAARRRGEDLRRRSRRG